MRFCYVVMLLSFAGPSQAEYAQRLLLEDVASTHIDHGCADPGHTDFKLLAPYWYKGKDGKVWTVPAGYVVNGGSIPQAAWSIIGGPWSGKFRNATVIHDYLACERISTSDYVHRLFLEGMIESGVPKVKAWVMYKAVLVGGSDWSDVPGYVPQEPRPVRSGSLEKLQEFLENNDISLEELEALELDEL